VHYTVRREDQIIDMDEVARLPREQGRRSSSRAERLFALSGTLRAFAAIADEVGAYLMGRHGAFRRGLVAGGVHPRVPHAHVTTTRRTNRCAAARRHDPHQ